MGMRAHQDFIFGPTLGQELPFGKTGDREHVNEEVKVPSRSQNATRLVYDNRRIMNVIQYIAAKNKVEARIRKGRVLALGLVKLNGFAQLPDDAAQGFAAEKFREWERVYTDARGNFLQESEGADAEATNANLQRVLRPYRKPSFDLRGNLTIIFQNSLNALVAPG
jgi:hypothetical protein